MHDVHNGDVYSPLPAEVLGPNGAGVRGDLGFLFVVFVFFMGVTHFGFALAHETTMRGLVRSALLSQGHCLGK